MKKFKVTIITTQNDFLPCCVMDQEMIYALNKQIADKNFDFLSIEDDTVDKLFFINKSHIVGIQCIEVSINGRRRRG